MFNIINRITWIISFLVSWNIMFFLWWSLRSFFQLLLPFIIIWIIIKVIFFSKTWIKYNLKEYQKIINLKKHKKVSDTKNKENTLLNNETEWVNEIEWTNEKISVLDNKESNNIDLLSTVEDENIKNTIENVENDEKTDNHLNNLNFIEKNEILEENKVITYIKDFFSENALAKIWGILIFLAVLFFIGIAFSYIWPVWKLIIWFMIGFVAFWIWVYLDKKELKNESRVLMWVGILINYLVILAWRYLLWNEGILDESISLIFLILNTVFAISVSMVYKSNTLLFFSFIFAYLNPLLVGWHSNEPYTLCLYSWIVSFWALIIAKYYKLDNSSRNLIYLAYFLWSLLFLIAPFHTNIWWIVKLISMAFLSWIVIFLFVKNKSFKDLANIIAISYMFLILLVFYWTNKITGFSNNVIVYLSYMIYILWISIFSIIIFTISSLTSFIWLFLMPLWIFILFILFWLFSGLFLLYAIILSFVFYIWIFIFLFSKFSNILRYIIFIWLWVFIIIWNLSLNIMPNIQLWYFETILTFIIALLFLITSYYFSKKENLSNLYTIWTVMSIIMVAPLIKLSWDTMFLSILFILIFWLLNIFTPILYKNYYKKNISSVLWWFMAWFMFILISIYLYWNKYFPWVSLGIVLLILWILYFIMWYYLLITYSKDKTSIDENIKNMIYTYMWVSLTSITISVAFLFLDKPIIISTIWFLQASLLFFFYNKIKNYKILLAGLILMFIGIIWLFKLIIVSHWIHYWDYMYFIPLSIMFLSLILNLKFINFDKLNDYRIFHDMLHIMSILLLLIIISIILWWWIFYTLTVSILVFILTIVYTKYSSNFLKKFLIAWTTFILLLHIFHFPYKLFYSDSLHKIYFYLSSIIILAGIYYFYNNQKNKDSKIFLTIWIIYAFIISTIYAYNIFNYNLFVITIYWGILAFILLSYWINKDKLIYRTVWNYILILALWKILIYDVRMEIDNGIIKVLALWIVGIFMIIVSSMYQKKYWKQIRGEFRLTNIISIIEEENKKNSLKK